jgi:hypothetical protein
VTPEDLIKQRDELIEQLARVVQAHDRFISNPTPDRARLLRDFIDAARVTVGKHKPQPPDPNHVEPYHPV